MSVLSEPRPIAELNEDEFGQMTTEWVLVTTLVVIPLGMTIPGIVHMFYLYFYRIAGVISLPFP